MKTPTTCPTALELPCARHALRQAMAHCDVRALHELTGHLRIAGYQFDMLQLASALLAHGWAWVADAFGQRVAVHVKGHAPGLAFNPPRGAMAG